MTNETQDGGKVHKFEAAGLGLAPFKIVGCQERRGPISINVGGGVTMISGAPGQPMGTCDYCGTGIAMCYMIRSADGREFIVGSDCVMITGDAGMTKIVKAEVAEARRDREAAKLKARLADAKVALLREDVRARLAAVAHPFGFAGLTMLNYAEYLIANGGNAGQTRGAKIVAKAVAELDAAIEVRS